MYISKYLKSVNRIDLMEALLNQQYKLQKQVSKV